MLVPFFNFFYQTYEDCLVFDVSLQYQFVLSILHLMVNIQIFSMQQFFLAIFFSKISLPVKNSNLLIFSDDKAEILAVCLSKLYWALFCSILLLL